MEQQTPLLQPTPPAAEQGRVEAIFKSVERRMGAKVLARLCLHWEDASIALQ